MKINTCFFIAEKFILVLFVVLIQTSCSGNKTTQVDNNNFDKDTLALNLLLTGAEQTHLYFPLIENQKIGIVTNQTGVIGNVHIVDSLVSAGMNVEKIFAPEHGFRGDAEAGEKFSSNIDQRTGIEVVSLYGANLIPKKEDIEVLDLVIFDIQDVGARFYTYISTMHHVMEVCAQTNVQLIILDRPNPNGFYVDGPILDMEYQSFIGMHPIPIVHGLTVGELAMMINGEGWLSGGKKCDVTVVPVSGYTHSTLYHLPIPPSPNLPNMASVYLYPSLCLFEGTVMSVGRGTDTPFEIFGHPLYNNKSFRFVPESRPGFAAKPPFMGEECFGLSVSEFADSIIENPRLILSWLIESYEFLHSKTNFFRSNMFEKLTGSTTMRKQIIAGKTEEEIRSSWQSQLDEYKKMRKKYLLYDDFE
jgi:uncharacterized protein YbbC (DUF1343 family)